MKSTYQTRAGCHWGLGHSGDQSDFDRIGLCTWLRANPTALAADSCSKGNVQEAIKLNTTSLSQSISPLATRPRNSWILKGVTVTGTVRIRATERGTPTYHTNFERDQLGECVFVLQIHHYLINAEVRVRSDNFGWKIFSNNLLYGQYEKSDKNLYGRKNPLVFPLNSHVTYPPCLEVAVSDSKKSVMKTMVYVML